MKVFNQEDVEQLSAWRASSRILYRIDEPTGNALYATLKGGFEIVNINDNVTIWSGMQPFTAMKTFVDICNDQPIN